MDYGLFLGSTDISKACLGSDEVEVYLGDELLWPQVREFKAALTLTGGTVVYVPLNGSSQLTKNEVLAAAGNATAITEAEISSAVTSLGSSAFTSCSNMSSVTIPESITSIGTYAFHHCDSLTGITIPSGVTQIKGNTFQYCISLTTLYIPSWITSIAENGFGNCSGLTSITVDAANRVYDSRNNCNAIIHTSRNAVVQGCQNTVIPVSIKAIDGSAFSEIKNLTACTIPSGVTSIGQYAFHWCNGLTGVTVEATTPPTLAQYNFDVGSHPIFVPCDSVAAYKSASRWSSLSSRIEAYGCPPKAILTLTGGTTVEIPANGSSELTKNEISGAAGSMTAITEAEITSSVTYLGGDAFKGASNMTSVTIPDSVIAISASCFYNCEQLTGVAIPNSVTQIGIWAFNYCHRVRNFTVPSGVTSIGEKAFRWCSGLTGVTVEATTPPTLGVDVFYQSNCPIFVPCGTLTAYTAATNWSTYASRMQEYGCPKAILYVNQTSYSIPDDGNTTLTSGEVRTALSNYTDITRAEIYDSVTSIGENAFISCKRLTSVTIPDSVTVIGNGSFNNCKKLKSVSIPSGVTSIGQKAFQSCPLSGGLTIPSAVTTINDYSFFGCSGLTSVTMHDGITSIGDSAFAFLTLTSLTLPSGVTSIGAHAFQYCSGLTSIVIPSGVTSISNGCFDSCSGLTSVTIPNSVTSIGSEAFQACFSLLEFTIPSGVTSISRSCFNACHAMSSITIPDSVTGIGYTSFQACRSLTSLTIPSAVTSIDRFAFASASGTTNGIKFESTTPPTLANVNAFTETNNCPIYVPCGSLTAYTAATNWSSLASRMQEYGCSDGPSATIHLKYWSDDGCDGEGCDIEDDRYIYGDITRAAVESAITDHDDVVRWGDVVGIDVASGVTNIGADAFNFYADDRTGWRIQYVKFLGTTPPSIGTHAFGGGGGDFDEESFDSMRYYILVPSAATTAYTSAFSAQSADFDGIYPGDVPCMAAVTSTWEGDPPTTSTTYVYGPATLINLAKNLGVWNAEEGVVSWGDFGGQIEEVRIGSATTSIAADAFNNTADAVNCDDGVFKWIIDTDTVTSIGVDAFGWLNMREVWLSGSTNVLHLDPMDHASFKVACTCPQYDEELDEDVDVDTWFNYNIYVDDSLLSAYQADSKWSGYGNRLKGESDWEQPEEDWCNHIDEEEPQIEP